MSADREPRIKRLFADLERPPVDPNRPEPPPAQPPASSIQPRAASPAQSAIHNPASETPSGLSVLTTPDGDEKMTLAVEPLTSLIWESFKLGRPVSANLPSVLGGLPIRANAAAAISTLTGESSASALAYARALDPTGGTNPTRTDQSLLFEVLDNDPGRTWSEDEMLLVEQVTDQLSLALENAQLFQQTQDALQALSISERYQKSIAQATAALTKSGLAALPDVLRILGEAAQASRAYYIETHIDSHSQPAPAERGPAPRSPAGKEKAAEGETKAYWRIVQEWHAEGVQAQIDNPALQQLSAHWLTPWLERLRRDGYIAEITQNVTPAGRAFLEELGSRSVLQFAVPGASAYGRELPGCIGFEQIDYARQWSEDEIAALQTAASALANTLAREDLLRQIQNNLAETETLYQASARMNSAASYQEILDVLRQHTLLGSPAAASVTINLFDRPWPVDGSGAPLYKEDSAPQWLIPIARWNRIASAQEPAQRYPLSAWKSIHLLLHSEQPTVVEDVANDPRLDDLGRAIYHEQLKVSALLYVPLNVSGRWVGHIIATYKAASVEANLPKGPTTLFPENEIRRLSALSGQAAVAIESLRLLDETQQRNIELATLNQVTGAASRSLELSEVLAEVLERVLQVIEFESGLVSILHPVTGRLYLAVHQNLPENMVRRLTEQGLDGTPCELVYRLGRQIYAADLNRLPEDVQEWESVFEAPKSIGFNAYLGVGLESKGVRLGTVCAFSKSPRNVSASRLELMSAIGQQVGVVVENARLFQSTQSALSETEMLYQASAELNAVQSFDDILSTLRKYSILGDVDEALSLDLFDQPWTGGGAMNEAPEKVLQAARWNAPEVYHSNTIGLLSETPEPTPGSASGRVHKPKTPAGQAAIGDPDHLMRRKTGELRLDSLQQENSNPTPGKKAGQNSAPGRTSKSTFPRESAGQAWSSMQALYPLHEFPPAEHLLRPDAVVAIENIYTDSRVNDLTRQYYDQRLASGEHSAKVGQRSLLYAPLVVGGSWIGFIHAIYRPQSAHAGNAHWGETDLRRLEVLASQAAVAAQNLRQVQQIQTRAQYEYLTREIGSQVSSTIDQDSILRITARSLAQALNVSHILAWATTQRSAAPNAAQPATLSGYLYDRRSDQFQTADQLNNLASLAEQARRRQAGAAGLLTPPAPTHNAQIMLRGEQIGEIQAFDLGWEVADLPTEWTDNDTALLQTISTQVALSLDNARLFQETQSALSETETLYKASAELNAVQSYDEILTTLRKYTILGQADNLLHISLFNRPWPVDGNGDPIYSDAGLPERITPIVFWSSLPPERLRRAYDPRSYSAVRLLSPTEIAVFEDIGNDPRLDDEVRRLYQRNFLARSTIFAPLSVGGQWIGFINGVYSITIHCGELEKRRLSALASQAAVAIQNLHLLEESRRRANQLQTAAEIARDTSSTLALQALMQRSVEQICQRFGYYHASIFLIDDTGSAAVIQEATGAACAALKRQEHSLDVGGDSLVGQVSATGQPLTLNDVFAPEAAALHHPSPLLPNTHAELGIPLKIGQRVIGVLDVHADQVEAFSEDDVAVLQVLADQIAVAVGNARAYELSQKAVEEIREADRLKTQFLANMSHELRTPLNSIIGFSRVILKGIDGPVTDLQTTDLSAIYNAGQHLLGLINDVLDVSKIEAGKMELAFEENVSLADIIKSVMSTTLGLVKDKGIELKQIVEPDLPRLRLDPMKVRQVLINLLSNASKFTEQGSIIVEAHVQNGPTGQTEVLVQVIDSGPGIAPKDQLKLFQPFSQVDGSLTRKTGGSGLGLSICHHLIRMHGGRIGLRSTVGKGTTFYFTLPVVGPEEPVMVDESIQPELPDLQAAMEELVPRSSAVTTPPQGPDGEATQAETAETPLFVTGSADAVAGESPAATSDSHPALDQIPSPDVYLFKGNEAPDRKAQRPQRAPHVIELPGPGASLSQPEPGLGSPAETGAPKATPDSLPTPGGIFTPAGGSTIDNDQPPAGLILSIDGDPQVVALYRRYLTNHNFTLISLNDLDQVATVARGLHPIAITLDVAMQPGKSGEVSGRAAGSADPGFRGRGDIPVTRTTGWQVLKALKNDPETRSIPVIICSLADEREKAFALGASAYLLKPILEDDLIGVIYSTFKPA